MANTVYINGHFLRQQITGVQRYGREVIRGFDRGGYPYEVLKPQGMVTSGRIGGNLWQQLVLPARKDRDDLLWSPANSGPVFARNHIITLHDIAVFPHPEWFSSSYSLWKRTLIPQVAKRAKGILTVSEFSKNVICTHLDIPPDKVKAVYNGVDTSRFKPAAASTIQDIRLKYDLNTPYLLTLGSLDPRKNLKRTIEAWKRCREQEKMREFVLAIAGGSNANFSSLELNLSGDATRMLGYVDDKDLPALYSGAAGFLLPSLFEGFGLPVIEAMACGTPVITSNTTALDEISGDAALKVTPTDINSIKEAILELLDSPHLQTKLTELGLKRAQRFSWDRAAREIYHFLTI
ncbi:Glycosyltransferase involved in cell wall bisynthesis [Fodinibius roseus]|uniref:Glycosyltransferase involved in cell wall bisynthesis n=1 Tax=Fodinibius roseus TaxID=1194090 RepID=A0A1M5DIE4_9BACT|nr:glycosyltransferase family 1 protein [Fodinibius roseus]SHF66661.1 Glycosyltransferase involved in cell wall bisynthesis [Fodinibius roseus]